MCQKSRQNVCQFHVYCGYLSSCCFYESKRIIIPLLREINYVFIGPHVMLSIHCIIENCQLEC